MRFLALVLVPAAVAVLAGCGDAVALDPVARAADASSAQSSEHMTLTGEVTSSNGTLHMSGSGDFQNSPQLGEMTVEAVSGGTMTMKTVQSGSRIYLSSDALDAQLPNGKTWVSIDLARAARTLGVDFGSMASASPSEQLEYLKKSAHVSKAGAGTIDGLAVTHYVATIDPKKAADLSQKLHLDVTYQPVDVWVDGQGLVRRMHMVYATTGSGSQPSVGTEMTIDLSNYGEPVNVDVPSDAVTFDATKAATDQMQQGGNP